MTTEVDDFLAHYGVKGMRWGVRRDSGGSKKGRTKKEDKIRSSRKEARRRRQTLSDKNLDTLVNRLQKEKKLKELLDDDLNPGRTATKRIVAGIGTVALTTVATAVLTGGAKYAVRAALQGNFSLKEAASYVIPTPKKK